jgi:hypothetical protein
MFNSGFRRKRSQHQKEVGFEFGVRWLWFRHGGTADAGAAAGAAAAAEAAAVRWVAAGQHICRQHVHRVE